MANLRNGRTGRRWAALLVVGGLLFSAGCSSTPELTKLGAIMSKEDLAARPTLDEQIADYDKMVEEIRGALAGEFPDGEWSDDDQATSSVADPSLPEGYIARSSLWTYSASISTTDEDKQRAIDAITPIVVEHGFGEPSRYIDAENSMQASGSDKYGATYDVGGGADKTTVRYSTGVHSK